MGLHYLLAAAIYMPSYDIAVEYPTVTVGGGHPPTSLAVLYTVHYRSQG